MCCNRILLGGSAFALVIPQAPHLPYFSKYMVTKIVFHFKSALTHHRPKPVVLCNVRTTFVGAIIDRPFSASIIGRLRAANGRPYTLKRKRSLTNPVPVQWTVGRWVGAQRNLNLHFHRECKCSRASSPAPGSKHPLRGKIVFFLKTAAFIWHFPVKTVYYIS